MERLSPEDQIMLWPDALWPQEIGALAILDGSGFRLDTVRQLVEGRLHLVPRFRQILYTPRRGLGEPLWLDAPRFDLSHHVLVHTLPPPAGEAALLAEVERLRRQRLDRSRPLWQMCFFTGLPDNRVGLFIKMHHAIADGIAGIATASTFLDTVPDTVPDPQATPPAPWTPMPPPSSFELFADNMRRHGRRWAQRLSALAHPVDLSRKAKRGSQALREILAAPPMPSTSLNRIIGQDRAIELVRGELEQVKKIAHAHDATVNDVLLTLTALGLRALLIGRGEPVDDVEVRIDVPVTLRPMRARADARGNLISQMLVPVPVGIADPALLLKHIAAETAARKAETRPSAGALLHNRIVRRLVLRLLRRRPVNVTTADLPGPPIPLYFAGARVLEVFPVLPLMANVSLGVGALSYAGQFNLTIVADRDTYPDLGVFTSAARAGLVALTPLVPD